MARVNVTLSPRSHELLVLEARRRGSSLAEVIRRAAEHYADKHLATFGEDSRWRYLGGREGQWVLYDAVWQPFHGNVIRMGPAKPVPGGTRCTACGELLPGWAKPGDFLLYEPPGPEAFLCAPCAEALQINYRRDQALPTPEDRAWLESDLSRLGEFEPFDWGPQGPPQGQRVSYEPGVGPVVEDSARG